MTGTLQDAPRDVRAVRERVTSRSEIARGHPPRARRAPLGCGPPSKLLAPSRPPRSRRTEERDRHGGRGAPRPWVASARQATEVRDRSRRPRSRGARRGTDVRSSNGGAAVENAFAIAMNATWTSTYARQIHTIGGEPEDRITARRCAQPERQRRRSRRARRSRTSAANGHCVGSATGSCTSHDPIVRTPSARSSGVSSWISSLFPVSVPDRTWLRISQSRTSGQRDDRVDRDRAEPVGAGFDPAPAQAQDTPWQIARDPA